MSETWRIQPISTTRLYWGSSSNNNSANRQCSICGVVLLTGEKAGFCCGPNGNRYLSVQPLPPLPDEFNIFLQSPDISGLSRKLNLIFSFAAMESTHAFPTPGNPSFIAVAGRIYHRVRLRRKANTAVRWMLYDGFEDSLIPHRTHTQVIPPSWIEAVRTSLTLYNPFVSNVLSLRTLRLQDPTQFNSASIVIQDSGNAEIAAVMCYENTLRSEIAPRSLLISTVDKRSQRIHTVSRLWEPMAYPLLFPHGTLGWGLRPLTPQDPFSIIVDDVDSDAATTQIWHYRARLLREPRFAIFGRLTNEYIVDMFSRELDARLTYIRSNKERIRAQEQDAALMGHEDVQDTDNVYLPASFLGSNRWSSNQIADSLTIAAVYGPPTFFVTFTCNGDWPEIRSCLRPGQTYTDLPVVVCRVFKQKLSRLMTIFRTMFPNAGQLLYAIQRVEFQKRGLPHAHILLKYATDCVSPDDIDRVISARIPEAADNAEIVHRFMLHPTHSSSVINHVPPSAENPLKYCEKWKNGARMCRFGYPKPPQQQTSLDSSNRVLYRREQGDSFVVPHCLPLLRKFECHMNVEIAGCGQLFQYLFKYIHKGILDYFHEYIGVNIIVGPDRARFRIRTEDNGDADEAPINEIDDYWNGRYLTSTEAAWRILGYNITQKTPSVTALPVHLPDSLHHQRYHRSNSSPTLSNLEHYFARPNGTFLDGTVQRRFKDLRYTEYFSRFRLQKFKNANAGRPGLFLEQPTSQGAFPMHVVQRDSSRPHLSRLQSIHVSRGELFYLRSLLLSRPGISWVDLRTIDGMVYPSFQAACIALGLFADKNEAQVCMQEAVETLRTPQQLRILFVHLLTNSCVGTPLQLWNDFREKISEDLIVDAAYNIEQGCNQALRALGSFLQSHGKVLGDYGLPQPVADENEVERELRHWSEQTTALRHQVNLSLSMFNNEQREIFVQIQYAILHNEPLLMFIDGKAGRGKTFLVNTLCAWVRSTARIVLPTATSAFAAQLYPGGRTTHSTFGVSQHSITKHLSNMC